MAQRFTDQPGADTWVFKGLAGVDSYELTESEEGALADKNATYYIEVKDVATTLGGKVAAGEWIDVVRGIDWLGARMQERIFFLLLNNKKIPYTDAGIDLVKGQVQAQLDEGVTATLLVGTPPPTVTAPKAASVNPTVRATRVLPNVNFKARLQGAIHAVQVTGTVTS
jgi:hypothetical protein